MAIVRNMWMRNTRQQVAGAVLYNLKGQTIQREKAASVANPRTTAQMDQRVKLANLVNFYRANKAWMARGAFESKKQTWSDYNAFVSANLNASDIYLTKTQASKGVSLAGPYKVTAGTLPELEVSVYQGAIEITIDASAAPTTVGALSHAIVARYPGIELGDQLSIIQYENREDDEGDKFLVVKPIEIILNSEDTRLLSAVLPDWTFTTTEMKSPSGTYAIAYSACVSRSVGGKIKVSTSWVQVIATNYLTNYTGDAVLQSAINSYGGSSVNFLDSNTIGLSSAPSGSGGGSGEGDPGDVTP